MMEMPLSIPKEMTANLPAAAGLPPMPIAGTGNGKDVKASLPDNNGFSKKLSDAIDKSAKSESITPKKVQKPQKNSDQEPVAEMAPTGLVVGLAVNSPQEIPPNAGSAIDTSNPSVPVTMSLVDVSGAFAQGLPMIAQGTGNQPLGAGQQGVIETLAPQTPVIEKTTVAPSKIALTAVAPQTAAMEKPTVALHKAAKETSATESQAAELIQTQRSNDSLPEENTPTGSVKEPTRPQPNIPTLSAETGSNQEIKPIDSRIQQDIVAIQVLAQPDDRAAIPGQISQNALATSAAGTMIVSKTTAANEMIPTSEFEPAETEPAIMVGKAEGRPEQVATAQTEPESAKSNLDRSEKDLLTFDAMDKTETPAGPIVPFEKTLSGVNSPSAPDTSVQQSRQDMNEVARQVMDGMTASTDRLKSSQVIITLRPEHLGEVTVKINVDGDRVTAAFHAASSEVRAILESSMPQLRQEMSQNGWKFDSDGVYGGMQQFLADQQQQRQAEPEQTLKPISKRLNRDKYDESIVFTSFGRTPMMSTSAVDYRV